jgi:uncharacterized damage-inducible protein DinB
MINIYAIFAKQNEAADKALIGILNGMSHAEREAARGSYYNNLYGLVQHNACAIQFILGGFKEAFASDAGKNAAFKNIGAVKIPEGAISEAQWKQFCDDLAALDAAFVAFAQTLREEDLNKPVKWFTGNPATVPLHFMLDTLITHGLHHRGQISQILDELKIDNNYSGVDLAFI